MVLVPTHTANAGIQFLSFPAQGTGELSIRQAFSFLASASDPHTREGISSPWNLFQQTQSFSLVCKLSLDFKISLFFRHAGPSASSQAPSEGTKIIFKMSNSKCAFNPQSSSKNTVSCPRGSQVTSGLILPAALPPQVL